MDKQTRNKVNMYKATGKVLDDHEEQLQDLTDYTEINGKFRGNITEIDKLDSQLADDTSGITEEKDALGQQLAEEAMKMSLRLKAHARKLEDKSLLNSVTFTKSQLFYVADQTLLSRASHLLTKAKEQAEGAATYGLTPEHITSMETLIAGFGASQPNPRHATINKKDLGAQLKSLVRETDNLLKEDMDVLLEVKGITDPELHSKYESAREIIDR